MTPRSPAAAIPPAVPLRPRRLPAVDGGPPPFRVLCLVHDLADPATARRVAMLQAGGAAVTLAGFRRTAEPVDAVRGLVPIDLGRTRDGRFAQRVLAVAATALGARGRFARVPRPDVIVARNLEMLALANRLNAVYSADIPIVYECLDIHRLMLAEGRLGDAMRAAERRLGRNAALLLTSSPAFLREYFAPRGQIAAPAMLLENRVLDLDGASSPAAPAATTGRPWTIGWFGALRCQRSLDLLSAFTRRMGGRFEVVMRGRPARSAFRDFDARVAAEPHIRFEGPYRNPEDLAAIYGAVHFTWAIDFYEEGLNSSWLLPNRLYEGCLHGTVPIAMRDTETGRFLAERGLGLRLGAPTVEALDDLVGGMDGETYAGLRAAVGAEPRAAWACGPDDCAALVDRLRDIAAGRPMVAECAA